MSTIIGTNIEVTNIKYDSDTTSMIISNAGQVTIQGEGSATTNLQQGLCKSWTTHSSASIIDSFNTASITDIAGGRQEVNFTNNMSGVGYAIAGLVGNNNNAYSTTMNVQRPYYWRTSGYRIVTLYLTNTAADYSHTDTQVTGDLA